jgi:hypothetical protein
MAYNGNNTMGYIPDLEECDWWHSPGLAYDSALPEQFRATMVGWLGEHRCEICRNHTDRGEILILYGNRMYVAPRMILHYIKAHAYRPPEEFLKVMQALDDQKKVYRIYVNKMK